MNKKLILAVNSIVSAWLLIGCAAQKTHEQRVESEKNFSIDERIKSLGGMTYSQDKDGNRVAFRQYILELIGPYGTNRVTTQYEAANCEANGGIFSLEKAGQNQINSAMHSNYASAYGYAMATENFWARNGISAPGMVQNAFNEEFAMRKKMTESAASMFDSAVRTENVGTFVCIDANTQKPKWRYNLDLYNAHRGYSSAGGNYRTSNYSAYFSETYVIYEKEKYKLTSGAYAKLPKHSSQLVYPVRGAYVVIEKNADKWTIKSIARFSTSAGSHSLTLENSPARTNERQEILIVSEDANFIVPAYRDKEVEFEYGTTDMGRNVCHIDDLKFRERYSVCNSAFTDAPKEIGGVTTGFAMLFSKDSNALYNLKQKRTVGFMEEKFRAVLEESGVQQAVRTSMNVAPSRASNVRSVKTTSPSKQR